LTVPFDVIFVRQNFAGSCGLFLMSDPDFDRRQLDVEPAALAGPAFDRDVAAMAGDDAMHHRQPETGAIAYISGRERAVADRAGY
jgi:hypothetical protein